MKQHNNDSIQTYFVTARNHPGPHPFDTLKEWLAATCTEATGDIAPRIVALTCLPESIVAVVQTTHWPGARPYRRAHFWRRSACGQVTAQHLSTDRIIRQKVDFCHFAPVSRGLVRHPEAWQQSTVRDRPTSEMLVA